MPLPAPAEVGAAASAGSATQRSQLQMYSGTSGFPHREHLCSNLHFFLPALHVSFLLLKAKHDP